MATVYQPDPATFEILWHRFMQITEEMASSYVRTSGSQTVVTGNDGAAAMTLADGQLVTPAPYIVTQANVLPTVVREILRTSQENPGIHPDDVFISNDPYRGAIHQPDVITISPVFYEDELVAWVGVSGHQLDIGGMDPGGFSPRAVDVYQEGLRIPPVKLVDRGVMREDIFRWINNQVRDPQVGLDIKAQLAGNFVGKQRLLGLLKQYGKETVLGAMQAAIGYSERRIRERLASLPDGEVRVVQHIDHDGHQPKIYRVVCTAKKEGSDLTFDFTGTDPQARGLINCTESGLIAGVMMPVYCLLCHDIPWNEGVRRAIHIEAPEGIVCNSVPPAPCSMATISGVIVVIDAVFQAIGQFLFAKPETRIEAMANWTGTSMGPNFYAVTTDGRQFVNQEMSHFAGGGGARTYADGVDTAGIIFNTTPNIANVETVEQDFPLLYLFRRQLQDSGGAGRWRGGVSGELAYVLHGSGIATAEVSMVGTGAEQPNAMGLSGGLPGATIRVVKYSDTNVPELLRAKAPLPAGPGEIAGTREVMPSKHPRSLFTETEAWYHNWQGGAGYGDPLERESERVLNDVLGQTVSIDYAERLYGVVIRDGRVDVDATERRRAEIRRERLERATRSDRFPAKTADRPFMSIASEYLELKGSAWCCARCGSEVGPANEDLRRHLALEETTVAAGGPVQGQEYQTDRYSLRLFYCPNCAVQMHTEIKLAESDIEPHIQVWIGEQK